MTSLIQLIPIITIRVYMMIYVYIYCTDQSSDSGVDQSHGGAPKARSTGRLKGQARVSVGSHIRGAEEGAASRQGMEAHSSYQ